MNNIYSLDKIWDIKLDIEKPCVIFLVWDLWAGKTTFSKHIIQNILAVDSEVTSPTYTYYNIYNLPNSADKVHHFDLYRVSEYEEFIHIGWEEILDNNSWVIIIEWPQILWNNYTADIYIELTHTEIEDQREIIITKKWD